MSDASPPWWEAFFDEEYLFLYGPALHAVRTEEEVRGLVELLRLADGARVLDLCCGDGRHAVALQRRGLRVTGVDLAMALLRRARVRRERVLGGPGFDDAVEVEGCEGGPWLVRADARRAPLRPLFDAALLLFNSIGYGTDADTLLMLRAARAALRAGGRGQLVLECAHRDAQVRRARPGREREWMDAANVRVLTERWIDPVEGVAHAVFRFARDGVEIEKVFRHRLYTPGELRSLLAQAGFTSLELYGGYDRRPFSLDAPQLLAHCRA